MKFDVVQSYILSQVVCKHPALVEEVDDFVQTLTEYERGEFYKAIFRMPVDGTSLAEVLMAEQAGTARTVGEELAGVRILSADEIMKTDWPEPIWTVPGLLPAGLVILAGAPKIGKSWMSLQLAKAIATGGEFLSVTAQRGKVLVCALEDSPQRLQSRIKAMGWHVPDPGPDPDDGAGATASSEEFTVDFITIKQMKGLPHGLLEGNGERLARTIEQRGYQLVVIDTLSRAIPGDQQDVQVMTRELSPLQEMSHELNCTIMLCDHHRKAGGMETDAIADILGSTAKGAMADTVWSLYRERGKNGAKLSITGRDVEEQTLQLMFDKATCCWQNLGETSALAMTDRRQEILDALKALGRVQITALSDRLKQDKGNLHHRLQDLANAGLVKREVEGPRIFYEVVK